MREFEELRIRVRPIGGGRHLVLAGGAASGAAVIRVGDEPARLRREFNDLIDIRLHRAAARGTVVAERLRNLGREVFAVLFGTGLDRQLHSVLTESHSLRLRFDLPPELDELPIETLCTPPDWPGQSLALDANRSLVRSVRGIAPKQRLPAPSDEPELVHTLIAVASPNGLAELDAAVEIAAARERWSAVSSRSEVCVGATRDDIETWVDRQSGPAAVLLIAHGIWDSSRGEGVVLLETEDGAADPVDSQLLSGILVRAKKLRLVMLNLCHSADSPGTETFAGLAQAIIGRGIPAVVGMNGLITNEAARKIGPLLLERVCSNKTLDEAVISARQLVPPQSIEWATLSLFCHESFGHSWLFKAREVQEEHGGDADPLLEGQAALDKLDEPGHLPVETLLQAARYLRTMGEWNHLLRIVPARHPNPALRLLVAEAEFELALPGLNVLCGVLAAEGDPLSAEQTLARIADKVPEAVLGTLADEVERLGSLDTAMERASRAAADGEWEVAAANYREVLEESGSDFRGAALLLETATEEAELAERYAAALAHRRARRWEQAREEYRYIIGLRDDYLDTSRCLSYVDGRIAEAGGEWIAAAEAYGQCGDYSGAPIRAAYALGRAEAEDENWESACEHFAEAGTDAQQWLKYASARAAEASEDWAGVSEHLSGLEDFQDAKQRKLLAAGHLAIETYHWIEAIGYFEQVPELDPPLEAGRDALYASARSGEAGQEWALAAAAYAALPADYSDASQRASYCDARLAESAGDWAGAAEHYRNTSVDDAENRLDYALGRLAEAAEDWLQASQHYSIMPDRLFDVAVRICYALGRYHDETRTWDLALAGFGELPDSFESGEVGRRRRFARASIAAADSDWESVIALLRESPDEERDFEVWLLRSLAKGMLAEAADDWAEACGIYSPVAEGETIRGSAVEDSKPDFERRFVYALLRHAESETQWEEVVELSGHLPPDYRDTSQRRRYASACIAVRYERWEEALDLCSELPQDFANTRTLSHYAKLRLAEAESQWAQVIDLAAILGDHRDAPVVAHYARGRIAEDQESWAEAAAAYGSCPGHADTDSRAAHAEARQLEQSGQLSAAIVAYEAAGDSVPGGAARLARLRHLLAALPWVEGIASATLLADPITLEQDTFPYLALRDAGITPASTTADVGDAAFMLMQRGRMGWQARVAWDRLRSPAGRLIVDAQLYWLREPQPLRDALAAMEPDDQSDPLAALCERLPADAPLFRLLSGARAEAISAWRERLVANPGDMSAAHCLALASYWQAQRLEETGAWEQAEATWRTALACWATVINDDDFWVGWRQARAACYGQAVTPADSTRLRASLGQHLTDVLARTVERHASAGRPGPAARNRALLELFESEMEAARCLKEAGGLPLPAVDTADDTDSSVTQTLACGPGYLEIAGLRESFARFVAGAMPDGEAGEEPAAINDALLRRLRWSFSELAVAFTCFEHHRFDAALAALPSYHRGSRAAMPDDCFGPAAGGHSNDCNRCRDFLARNAAYAHLPQRRDRLRYDAVELGVRVHMSLAHGLLLTPDRLAAAMAALNEAVAVAGGATMTVRTRQAALWMILGRAEALADSGTNQVRRVNEAIALLEAGVPVVGSKGRRQLDRKRADLLVDRAILSRTVDLRADIAGPLDDMRTAFRLHSGSIRIIENLARALLTAVDRLPDHRIESKLEHLHEALTLLDHGFVQFPRSARLRSVLGDVLDEVKSLNLTSLSVEELAELVETYEEPDEEPESLAARAKERLAAGDATGAIDDLVRAVAAVPSNGEYRAALLDALGRREDA
ncbi:CHAT domain-containing protein [Glycomyces buryatensis]|uniref:CHAT domain-containing protein n=1 Tax=Glycomyces buryatensis TaxID=2570927 RepID=A0A4S8Q688_9ACTN|nr:CHAT domain-containing protein [Glycomyces buryatensis]THV39837.1 CHAT domain-containing protein [Glycomyces buryatensis]